MSFLPVVYDQGVAYVLDKPTGEIAAIGEATPDTLAAARERLDDIVTEARDARTVVDTELLARMKDAGDRLLEAGAHRVEAKQRREWDTEATWAALGQLLEAGHVSSREIDEAMPEVTVRKPDGRKLNALLERVVGLDPEAASALARARAVREYVAVQRVAVDGSVAA